MIYMLHKTHCTHVSDEKTFVNLYYLNTGNDIQTHYSWNYRRKNDAVDKEEDDFRAFGCWSTQGKTYC